ncbi:acetoacetate decarboxylase family protein [Mycolicibacillus parakoreensis]|uniref:Acetoacetate decarboxylase family protein n=1 Tax=Mycolicibacillus parakoreensis TaxID=1069221 RepID=A0ABY3U7U2_9MYCO|nr:acetoacetate decarboxylase family protein [Mycolicibacillus parakoreensis]MCV7313968.1 acetoacetate decarboxylase family protein [Mycolicibacillus parakoreensis]ULN54162.1 acetoacetate decarboxylase family protein [Mycolicibacillus parakoreensis]
MSSDEPPARLELSGLPGIPEVALSAGLLARLPQNSAPAPWHCQCSAVVWLGRGGRAATAALPSGLTTNSALMTVGGFVRYTDTPVGPYDEVLGLIGSRSGATPWGTVALMAVDSAASLVGGRTNWAMPKTLARFDGEPAANTTMTARGDDALQWEVGARPRVLLGPSIPVKAAGAARQVFSDGRIGESRLRFSGRVRPALVNVTVTSAGSLSSWLRPGRHLGAVIDSAAFTLDEPRFR